MRRLCHVCVLTATFILTASTAMRANAADCCTATDNGVGTVDLPADCPFTSLGQDIVISNGLPSGTTIVL